MTAPSDDALWSLFTAKLEGKEGIVPSQISWIIPSELDKLTEAFGFTFIERIRIRTLFWQKAVGFKVPPSLEPQLTRQPWTLFDDFDMVGDSRFYLELHKHTYDTLEKALKRMREWLPLLSLRDSDIERFKNEAPKLLSRFSEQTYG